MQDLTRTLQEAESWLSANDPLLGAIISNGPSLSYKVFNKEPFEALVQAVISQQLSVKSASAIQQRVHRLLATGDVSAYAFGRISAEQLKKAGMSAAKVRTVESLIEFALAESNRFDVLHKLPNQEVKRQLCALKGVGPWTADIFLMFGLKRLDVFAAGDLGLRKAVKQLHKLKELPSADECRIIAKKWQPYRTVAAWHLWQTID
ncbi:MAG: hypothetical protein AB1Y26_08015 [Cycloclasticus sp.]